jgi:T5SS/PEP-CTERM-associated repeat protein
MAGGQGRAGGQRIVMHDGAELSAAGNLWLGVDAGFNRLEITAGSRLTTADSLVGLTFQASSNAVLVSDPGSSWTSRGLLLFASNAMACQLVVSNGAALRTGSAIVGARSWRGLCGLHEQNRILVTGTGSRWENAGELVVGGLSFTGTEVVLEDGATLSTQGRAIITRDAPPLACLWNPVPLPDLNRIRVAGGTLAVTNAARDAVLEPRFGTLTVSSGLVLADHLVLTNIRPFLGALELNGGVLRVHQAFFRHPWPVVVGDGTHQANLEVDLVDGITPWLSTAGGLVVATHGILSGGAIVEGAVTNFGVLRPSGAGMSGFTCLGPVFCMPGSSVELRIRSAQFGDGLPRGFDQIGLPPGSRLGGRLRVKLLDGFIPAPADEFPVLSVGEDSGEFLNAPNGGRVRTEDGLGSFLVTYTSFSLRLGQFKSLDQDGDGIADDWAVAHFGHSPLTAQEKGTDADGDGMSNGEEFRAGTDPLEAASVLRARIRWQGGRAEVEFPIVEGKSYRLLASCDLVNWVDIASSSLTYPASGRCQWTEDGRDTSSRPGGARFFRVVIGH